MKNIILLTLFFFLNQELIMSQSPGGVSGGATNQIWFDADQLILNDGDIVQSMADFSGAGNNTVTSGVSNSPIYSSSAVNGKPSLIFDGVNDFLRTGAIGAMNTGTISTFVVFDGSSANHVGFVLAGSYTERNNYISSFRANGNIGSWVIELPSTIKNNVTPISSSYQLLSSLWDSGGAGDFSTYKNGTLVGTRTGLNDIPSGNSGYSIGSSGLGSSPRFNGGIAEVIVYSSTLNSAERNIVTNYLGAKYNLTVANDFYAFESTHGNDVIGLGQESDGSNTEATSISTLQISDMSTPGNGDYILIGHDGEGLVPGNNSDVPAAGSLRYGRVWRSDITGTPGTITITYDLSETSLGFTDSYVLLVDGDGVFASGAIPYSGVYDDVAKTISFTNIALSDGDYLTLSNTNTNIQSTGVTSDWNTTTTWNCGCVPALSNQVEIQLGHTVNISGQNSFVGNLTINGSLTFSGNDSLTLNQNLVNNGTFSSGTGTVIFQSNGLPQTISGTQTFHNLNINNLNGVSIVSGTTSVQGFLDVISGGSFTTNNSLTMLSNALGTGSFKNPSSGTIIGNITAERFLNEGQSYYLLGSPLIDADIEDWNQEFEMSGFSGTGYQDYDPSVFYYDETANMTSFSDGYQVPSSTSDILTNTKGWTIYVGDDSFTSGARTIDLTGTPRLGDGIVVNGTYTSNIGDPSKDGWNLVSNPYQSPVRFVDAKRSANYDVAYRKVASGSTLGMTNAYVLAPGEAFWLHCLGGPCSLTFDASDVYSVNEDNYNSSINQEEYKLLIKLHYGTESNTVKLGFLESADDNYNVGLDQYKLDNLFAWKPNLSIFNQNGKDLSQAVFNDNFTSSIPLRIYTPTPSTVEKKYSLSIQNIDVMIEQNKYIVLEDKLLNTFTSIVNDTIINFMMYDTVTIPRFYLNVSSPLTLSKVDVSCYNSNDGKLKVAGKGNGPFNYIWYDEFMNVITTNLNVNGDDSLINLSPGKYKVIVENNDQFGNLSNIFTIKEPVQIFPYFESFRPNFLYNSSTFSSSQDTLNVLTEESIEFNNLSSNANTYLWDFGDRTTSSLHSPQHIYFNEGLYEVKLTASNGNCSKVSSQYVKVSSALGINENNLLNNFNVIVRENEIIVSLNNEVVEDVIFNVYNSIGQSVYTKNVKAGVNHQEKIQLNNAQGIYLVEVRDGNYTKTKKIVLNNK